jgi:hypothetical protein
VGFEADLALPKDDPELAPRLAPVGLESPPQEAIETTRNGNRSRFPAADFKGL